MPRISACRTLILSPNGGAVLASAMTGSAAQPKLTAKKCFSRNFRRADKPPLIEILPWLRRKSAAVEAATAPPSGDAHVSHALLAASPRCAPFGLYYAA